MAPKNTSGTMIESEAWTDHASKYTDVTGKTTVFATSRLVDALHAILPFDTSSHVIDVGCGTGSLTIKIHEKCPDTKIVASDIATGMLRQVDQLNLYNVSTKQADGCTLAGLEDDSFSHGVSSFAISFMPDPRKAVESIYRVVRPGGLVGVVTWGEKVDWANAIGIAGQRLNPEFKFDVPEHPLAWHTAADHAAVLEQVGLKNVRAETLKMPVAAKIPEGVTEHAFRGGNPVMNKFLNDWKAIGGELEPLEEEYVKVLRDVYADGVFGDAILGWGQK